MEPVVAAIAGGSLVLLGGALVAGAAAGGWFARGPSVRLAEGERDVAKRRADAAEFDLARERERKSRNRDQDHEDIEWVLNLDSADSDDSLWDRVRRDAPTERTRAVDGPGAGPEAGDQGGPGPLASGGTGANGSGDSEAGPSSEAVAREGEGGLAQ